jgi:hypothetical protein
MRIVSIALALLAAVSCAGDPDAAPHPGDATLLAGTWALVVHRDSSPDIVASVTLTPSDSNDPDVPPSMAGGTLEGHFRLQEHGWLAQPPVDSGASAFVDVDSSVVVYLWMQGRCVRCGNLGFAGRLGPDGVSGHWTQELGSNPPQGTFDLRRSP